MNTDPDDPEGRDALDAAAMKFMEALCEDKPMSTNKPRPLTPAEIRPISDEELYMELRDCIKRKAIGTILHRSLVELKAARARIEMLERGQRIANEEAGTNEAK